MPRYSTKRKLIIALEQEIIKRRGAQVAMSIVLESEDDKSIAMLDDLITEGLEDAHVAISQRRYAFSRKPYRKGYKKEVFQRDLEEDDKEDGTPPWLTDDEFIVEKYRMSRDSFKELVNLIKDHAAF